MFRRNGVWEDLFLIMVGFVSNNGFRHLNYVLIWRLRDLAWLLYALALENLLIENHSSLEEIIKFYPRIN